jgi:indolepyruvate ferredoxin oxidoreductase alpha subunit
MNGLDAAVCALSDSDVKIVTGVPGFPITELMDNLGNIKHEWSVNEKVALEFALGSSVTGQRSAVITKHVGMNILADPLVTSPTHTIGAGVVIIAGDDAGVEKSQNEQDSRFYGLIAEVPVFDPSTPQKLYESIMDGFELSEKASAPIIIRVTDRLLKSKFEITRKDKSTTNVTFDRKIWHLTMLGKHQRFHMESYQEMCKYAESSRLNRYEKRGVFGVISSGFPSALVESIIPFDVSFLSLTIVSPLPYDTVNHFIDEHERILLIEETEPFIEKQLGKRVLGKLTGHMPYGRVEIEDIRHAIKNIDTDYVVQNITPQTIELRGSRPICDNCPYLPLYKAIKELNVPVAGDLGCSILSSSPPLSLIDAAFSLGSSICTASGFSRKGIAIIGDFGLAHSGLSGLINAVHNNHEMLIVVLQNDISAMTGGQKVPDLTDVISSYIEDTNVIDSYDDIDINKLLKEKLNKKGISVILARAQCPKY